METLLYRLRKRDHNNGPTPYLDMLIAAFQQERIVHVQSEERAQVQALPEPLSKREMEALKLLARGASNQEIAQELVKEEIKTDDLRTCGKTLLAGAIRSRL